VKTAPYTLLSTTVKGGQFTVDVDDEDDIVENEWYPASRNCTCCRCGVGWTGGLARERVRARSGLCAVIGCGVWVLIFCACPLRCGSWPRARATLRLAAPRTALPHATPLIVVTSPSIH
jgi:hypothetical protein